MNIRTLLLCIPTILVTLVFDFVPWGIVTAVITLAIYGFALFVPGKTVVKANVNVALEGLSYGDLKGAEEHINIALREVEMAKNISADDIELLRSACEKVASALTIAGQTETGASLLKRSRSLTTQSR